MDRRGHKLKNSPETILLDKSKRDYNFTNFIKK